MATARTINAYASLGPGQKMVPYTFEAPPLPPTGVEVKVTHCGLCGSDVHLWQSDGGYKDFTAWAAGKEAQICGHEVIGEVTAVGSAVTHVKVGQRAGIGWQNGSCHNCEWCLKGEAAGVRINGDARRRRRGVVAPTPRRGRADAAG